MNKKDLKEEMIDTHDQDLEIIFQPNDILITGMDMITGGSGTPGQPGSGGQPGVPGDPGTCKIVNIGCICDELCIGNFCIGN